MYICIINFLYAVFSMNVLMGISCSDAKYF